MENQISNKLTLAIIARYLDKYYRGMIPRIKEEYPEAQFSISHTRDYKDIPYEPAGKSEYDEVVDNQPAEVLSCDEIFISEELESPDYVDSFSPYYLDASLFQDPALPESENPELLIEAIAEDVIASEAQPLLTPPAFQPEERDAPLKARADLQAEIRDIRTGRPFNQKLLDYLIDKKIENGDFQRRANMSRQVFSNIAGGRTTPKKETVLSCVMGLGLSLKEAEDLLQSAGYSFSNADLTDMIVKCFVEYKDYDIDELNDILVNTYHLPYLGTREYRPKIPE